MPMNEEMLMEIWDRIGEFCMSGIGRRMIYECKSKSLEVCIFNNIREANMPMVPSPVDITKVTKKDLMAALRWARDHGELEQVMSRFEKEPFNKTKIKL